MNEFTYGFQATLRGATQDEAVERVTTALANEGFDVVSSIDLRERLIAAQGGEFRAYRILAAFSPSLAQEALSFDPHIGLLLPCNVVIQATEAGDMVISIADPKLIFSLIDVPALASLATDAQRRMLRVADVLSQSPEAV